MMTDHAELVASVFAPAEWKLRICVRHVVSVMQNGGVAPDAHSLRIDSGLTSCGVGIWLFAFAHSSVTQRGVPAIFTYPALPPRMAATGSVTSETVFAWW